MSVRNYRDLEVWQEGRRLVKQVYLLTRRFPKEELYGIVQQMRRAAISIPCNIAEGHSRHSTRDYVNFVSMAIGSLAEIDTQFILAQDLEYLQEKDCIEVVQRIQKLQRMLHALRTALKAKLSKPELIDA